MHINLLIIPSKSNYFGTELKKTLPVMICAITCDVHPGFVGRMQGKDMADGGNSW